MILDWTEKNNKKYIPIVTFVIGCAVGAVVMKIWMESKGAKMEAGGTVQAAPATTVIQVAPAQQAPAAPVQAVPAMPQGGGGFSGSGVPM